MRRDKLNYYLDIAETVLARGTCLRRNFGAIIVKNDQIISTGYVGAPRGRENCCDLGYCTREKLQIPRGERYELCRSVQAEANAIISGVPDGYAGLHSVPGGREVQTGEYVQGANPCAMCKRMIINAGIETVVIRDDKEHFRVYNVHNQYILQDDPWRKHGAIESVLIQEPSPVGGGSFFAILNILKTKGLVNCTGNGSVL